MTEPTDAELAALAVEINRTDWDDAMDALICFARAVLARWGQPAHSGEPVAWQSRTRPTWGGNDRPWSPWESCTRGQAEDYWKTPLLHDWAYEARALYTAPQPSPAAQGDALDAARYAIVRRGQHWSVIDGLGDPLTGDRLDAAVDVVRAAQEGKP